MTRKLMSTVEAAEFLCLTKETLRNWRNSGIGPDYYLGGPQLRQPNLKVGNNGGDQYTHTLCARCSREIDMWYRRVWKDRVRGRTAAQVRYWNKKGLSTSQEWVEVRAKMRLYSARDLKKWLGETRDSCELRGGQRNTAGKVVSADECRRLRPVSRLRSDRFTDRKAVIDWYGGD